MATKKAKNVTPAGIAVWPNITTESEFEGKKTGKFDCKLKFDPSIPAVSEWIERVEEDVNERIDTYLDKKKADDKKAFNIQSKWQRRSPFIPELDEEGNETGLVTIKFTRKVDKGVPKIVDAKKTVMTKLPKITGGSLLKVAYGFGGAYGMPSGKFLGVPMYMNIVQVLELASFGGSDVDDFEEEEGYEYDEDSIAESEPEAPTEDEDEDDDF